VLLAVLLLLWLLLLLDPPPAAAAWALYRPYPLLETGREAGPLPAPGPPLSAVYRLREKSRGAAAGWVSNEEDESSWGEDGGVLGMDDIDGLRLRVDLRSAVEPL